MYGNINFRLGGNYHHVGKARDRHCRGTIINKSLAVAEMSDRLATTDMG